MHTYRIHHNDTQLKVQLHVIFKK